MMTYGETGAEGAPKVRTRMRVGGWRSEGKEASHRDFRLEAELARISATYPRVLMDGLAQPVRR